MPTLPESVPILPENVPILMPELPPQYTINTAAQFKAISDPVRSKILGIVQLQPASAKQIAERLGASPGAIGHHLHVLEEAGLVQIVARRLVRGIVSSYYTRTARIFAFELPLEVTGNQPMELDIINRARDELAEVTAPDMSSVSFPHARLSAEKARHYEARLTALLNDLLAEPADPTGSVYGVLMAMFQAPGYVQGLQSEPKP
jgi:DNA-binding transcriptional ArsR family regulator